MSALPTEYERQANFTSYEATHPTTPKPGASLDAEFNAIETALDETQARLAEIQRDDGALMNAIVTPDALSAAALTLIGSSLTPRGAWVTATVYSVRDLVVESGLSYVAITEHVSGTFATDLAAGKWQLVLALPVAGQIAVTPAGALAATNVQAALAELDADLTAAYNTLNSGKQAAHINLDALVALTLAADKLPYATGAGTLALADLTADGRGLIGAANYAAMRTLLSLGTAALLASGSTNGTVPIIGVGDKLAAALIPEVTAAMLAATLDLSSKTVTLPPSSIAVPYLEYRDEKAANTAGGTATAGSFETRTLNTEHADAGNHGSLAANQITLAAGTYEADIAVPGAGGVNAFIAKLRNITDGADTLTGTSAIAGGGNIMAHSRITGRFTIAAPKVFEVQMCVATTVATNGWGFPTNLGIGEMYTVARFRKVG